MEAQEIFDQVVSSLRKQNSKSVAYNEDGTIKMATGNQPFCMYRSTDGKKCGAGWLINDDEYDPNMEGIYFPAILAQPEFSQTMRDRLLPHNLLISDLQRAHDFKEVSEWESSWQYIAEYFKLTYTPPEQNHV